MIQEDKRTIDLNCLEDTVNLFLKPKQVTERGGGVSGFKYFPKGIFPRETFQVTICQVVTSQCKFPSGNLPNISFGHLRCNMGEGQKAAHLWKIVPFHVLKSRLLYTRICFYQLISQEFYTVNNMKQKEKALAFRNVFAFF